MRQQYSEANCICEQQPVKSRKNTTKEEKHWVYYLNSKTSIITACKRGEYNYALQTASHNIFKRCSNTITETTMNSTQSAPIQSQDHIQA